MKSTFFPQQILQFVPIGHFQLHFQASCILIFIAKSVCTKDGQRLWLGHGISTVEDTQSLRPYRSYIFITWILNFHLWIWYVSWSVLLVWCQLGTIGSSSYISLGQCVASDGEKKRAFWTVGVSRRIWKCDFPGESGTVCGVSFHQSHPSCWKRKLSKSLWASCIVAAAECKARPNFAQNLWQGHGSQNPIWETCNIACFSTAKAFHPNYLQTKPKATQGQSQETHVAVDLKIVPAVAASDQLRQNQSIVEWKQWIKTQDTIWRQRLYLAGRHLSQHHMKCLRSSHEL